jgi:hypothetical protein
MVPLNDDDLAYMRATQAEHRPTEAAFSRRVSERTPEGGAVDTWPGSDPIDVRLDGPLDKVPENLADRYENGDLVQITMDLVQDVRSGDRVTVSPTEVYEVVSDGDPDRWATAQIVFGRRITWPPRG